MRSRPFRQVDVFGGDPAHGGPSLSGNPVAVVLDAAGLDDATMRAFARWTNLSETTFVLPPDDPAADYRLRIFTPTGELPFAGHPTLGSAWAVLEHTGSDAQRLVQECGAGLVEVRRDGDRTAFAAPPLVRSGSPEEAELAEALRALGLERGDVLDAAWVDNGPGWLALRLESADAVLAVRPPVGTDLKLGVVGPHPAGAPADFEVRAFVPSLGVAEDPVTGSLNAGIAQWFFASGVGRGSYTVRQGTAVGAAGDVRLEHDPDGTVRVGGRCRTVLSGTALL